MALRCRQRGAVALAALARPAKSWAIPERDGVVVAASVVFASGEPRHIGEQAVVEGNTRIGDAVHIGARAVVGGAPQDRRQPDAGALVIGDRCTIGDRATVNVGAGVGGVTTVGDDVTLGRGAHVGHDCTIGDGARIGKRVLLGGHVVVAAGAVVEDDSAVQQRTILTADRRHSGMIRRLGAAARPT